MPDLHLGDCMDIMAGMDSNSVDALITDPPAGIAFMGKAWDKHNRYEPRSYRAQETYSMLVGVLDMEPWEAGFVAFTIDWALEALRVLKPGAHGLVWALPRTSDLTGIGLRAAGFEIRDNVYHIFSTGFPKSFDIGKGIDAKHGATRKVVATVKKTPSAASENMNDGWRRPWAEDHPKTMDITEPATDDARTWDGWGTALKPAAEEWILIRKPFSGNVVDNVLGWGTGAINIDACRVPITDGAILGRNNKPGSNGWKNSSGGPTNAILYGEPNGRWPANVVTDGSDEVVNMFPETLPGKRAHRGGWDKWQYIFCP